MKRIITFILIALPVFLWSTCTQLYSKNNNKLPKYDHIVIIIEENKDYSEVIGNKEAPYINNVLIKEGANFTQMFAEEHNSEGNYFWLFSGNNQNVGFDDIIPTKWNRKDYPLKTKNLAQELIKSGYSFKGYSESLPFIGCDSAKDGLYARKHVPWISFGNIPNGNTEENSVNLQFEHFPNDFSKLPTVSIVIPNLINDMHNGDSAIRVKNGDDWLRKMIDSYYQWAKAHNSLLIITFDESDNRLHKQGLTNPGSTIFDSRNIIPTIFAGAHIKHGNYKEGKGLTHINLLRTIEAIYGLPNAGHQQVYALKYGIKDDFIIKDIFKTSK